jgi:hypothetical protein
MTSTFQLALQDRLALGAGQALNAGYQRGQLLAARRHLGWLGHAVEVLVEMVVDRLIAQGVEGSISDDGVEPRPEIDLGVTASECAVRLGQRLLDDVLGAVAWHDRSGEGHELGPVAPDDLLERQIVSLPDQADQPRIRLAANCCGCQAITSVGPAAPHQSPFVLVGCLGDEVIERPRQALDDDLSPLGIRMSARSRSRPDACLAGRRDTGRCFERNSADAPHP